MTMGTQPLTSLPKPVQMAASQLAATRARAYAPFSNFEVVAGCLLQNGRLITGTNYESASYGLTLCAERAAITAAQTDGSIELVSAILLSAANRLADVPTPPATPCGACRQWIVELASRLGRCIPVYCFDSTIQECLTLSSTDLLPAAFDKAHLNP